MHRCTHSFMDPSKGMNEEKDKAQNTFWKDTFIEISVASHEAVS